MKSKIHISLRTHLPTTDWSFGQCVLNAFLDIDPKLTPQTICSSGLKVEGFESLENCESHWAKRVVTKGGGGHYYYNEHYAGAEWKRQKSIKYKAVFEHTRRDRKNWLIAGRLSLDIDYNTAFDWATFFDRLCDIFQPYDGMMQIHNAIEPEIYPILYQGKIENLVTISIIPKITKSVKPIEYISDELFQKIQDNEFSIQNLTNAYRIDICDDLHCVVNDYELFSARRAKLKSLFPKGTFRVTD